MEAEQATVSRGAILAAMFRVIPRRLLIEPTAAVVRVAERRDGAVAALRVDGLLCSVCAANVRGRLERTAGVLSARVDLERGSAQVRYDPARTTPRSLIDAVEGAVVLRPVRRLLAALSGRRQRRAIRRLGSSDPNREVAGTGQAEALPSR